MYTTRVPCANSFIIVKTHTRHKKSKDIVPSFNVIFLYEYIPIEKNRIDKAKINPLKYKKFLLISEKKSDKRNNGYKLNE